MESPLTGQQCRESFDPTSADRNKKESPKSIGVFIVDDEIMVGEVVEAILKLEGYSTKMFQNPVQALQYFKDTEERPDILLTDYVMGTMNGMELIAQCKKLDPKLKTVLYSGNVGEEILDYYSIRPDHFLSKPFQPKVLTGIIKNLLSS